MCLKCPEFLRGTENAPYCIRFTGGARPPAGQPLYTTPGRFRCFGRKISAVQNKITFNSGWKAAVFGIIIPLSPQVPRKFGNQNFPSFKTTGKVQKLLIYQSRQAECLRQKTRTPVTRGHPSQGLCQQKNLIRGEGVPKNFSEGVKRICEANTVGN